MTDLDALIQDLRAHAHEAPAHCAALMRLAATELQRRELAQPRVANIADVAARVPALRPAKEKASCA